MDKNKEVIKVDDTVGYAKYDETTRLWYVEADDGQTYSAEAIEALEEVLRKAGKSTARYNQH